jgi:hypothetical protein
MRKERRMRTPEARTSCTESSEDGNHRTTNDETSVSAAATAKKNDLLVLFMHTPWVFNITVKRAT